MSVIDLDQYPDGTEEVLIALWEYEQDRKDDELQNEWINRRLLAGRTSLTKQQVRYRLEQLTEDNYVTQDTVTEHNQRVNYYALPPDGKESAKAIGEAREVLGEVPEEVTRQDLLKLTNEMAALRAEVESAGIELGTVSKSKYIQELESLETLSETNKKKIKKLKEYQFTDEERLEKIETKLGINSS
jgi:hypothetical protein